VGKEPSFSPDSSIRGVIFNCESFSLHNGPGIRTTLFLKGCPLRCLWCANPESWNMEQEVSCNQELCIRECRECENIAGKGIFERDPEGKILIAPGISRRDTNLIATARSCPSRALSVLGSTTTAAEAVDMLLKDRPFFEESGGGVTISGGEPLIQPEFTTEILRRLKNRGIHTVLDTCGDAAPEVFKQVSCLADLVLFDVKAATNELHQAWTGKSNRVILSNLEQIAAERPEALRIRIPYIPGLNSTDSELRAMAKLLNRLDIDRVDLLPYHRLGIQKYRQLGRTYTLASEQTPDSDSLTKALQLFSNLGIKAQIEQ
jgi:pyruvate formate lyase activating enzyme